MDDKLIVIYNCLIGFKTQSFCHNEIKNGYGLEAYDILRGMLCELIQMFTKVNG